MSATNWTPTLAPGSNDTVIIASGVTVTLNTAGRLRRCHARRCRQPDAHGKWQSDGARNAFVDGRDHERERTDHHRGGRHAQHGQPRSSVLARARWRTAAPCSGRVPEASRCFGAVITNRAGALFDVQNAVSHRCEQWQLPGSTTPGRSASPSTLGPSPSP